MGAILLSVGQSSADAVIDWNATAITVMLKVPTLARSATNDLAYVHVAIYDAVNAIDGRYSVFAVAPSNAAPWASKEAATAAAARRVLLTFYAPQQPYIDSVYAAALALLPNDSTRARGIAIGDTVATRFLALRAGDGRDAVVTYVWLPPGPGVYQPTPPGAAQYQPVNPWLPQLRPFSFSSPSQFRAPGPASLTSDVYTRDFNETKRYGSRDSSLTTPVQREIARFHTENPNVQLARNIRLFATARGMSLADNARLFAQLYVTIGDATIAGFESKYYYNAWRPSTAIRAADSDGNPLTERDTSWLPLVTTPPHPEYPGAHGFAMGGLANGLARFFGTTNVPVTLTSNVTGTQHSFNNTDEITTEAINARVYGGMHFRSSVEDGVTIGRKVADLVADHYFRLKSADIPTAGLKLWLKADAGVDALNGTVSRWHDQSGNGNDALQPDTARQPFLLGNAVNDMPALRFDGVNDRLGFTGTTRMSQFSIFIVQKIDSGFADAHYYYPITLGDQTGGYGLSMRNGFSNNSPDEIDPYVGENSWVRAVTPGCAAFGQWKIVDVIANQTMWNTTMHVNGVAAAITPQGFENAALSVPLGNATSSDIGGGLGMTSGVAIGYLIARCHVAEVLVYSSALSDSARQAVENYLNVKYHVLTPSVAGLQLWLKSDQGVILNGTTVNRWVDQSGNGNDAIQADASRQPLLVAGALNGKPVLRFDGLNDKLGFTGTTHMTQFSLFLVINNHLGSAGNEGNVITFGANRDFDHQWYMGMAIPAYGSDTLGMAGGVGIIFGWVRGGKPGLVAHDAWRNLSVVLNQTIWNTTLRWDGNDVHMFPGGFDGVISVPLGDATGSGGGIGGADGVPAGTILAKCDVAEMLVYNVALSDPVRRNVEIYLATKYGLPSTTTGVVENQKGNLPERFVLEQNYPNPFNPSTTIRYGLPQKSAVQLTIFNTLGQQVATIVQGEQEAGNHEVRFDASGLSSGVYFYRLSAGQFVQTRKLLLLR